MTHKQKFGGLQIPFGAEVLFKPSGVRLEDKPVKWESDAKVGVFAGYVLQPGYTWQGEYLVWPLSAFLNFSLKKDTPAADFRIHTPHRTKVIKFRNRGGD